MTDPLGNPLVLSIHFTDCPYPCTMTLPHYHSIILCRCGLAVSQAWRCQYGAACRVR